MTSQSKAEIIETQCCTLSPWEQLLLENNLLGSLRLVTPRSESESEVGQYEASDADYGETWDGY